jgi:hypothetical protein
MLKAVRVHRQTVIAPIAGGLLEIPGDQQIADFRARRLGGKPAQSALRATFSLDDRLSIHDLYLVRPILSKLR